MIIEAGSVVVNETEQGNRGNERGEYSARSVGGEKIYRCSGRWFTRRGQWGLRANARQFQRNATRGRSLRLVNCPLAASVGWREDSFPSMAPARTMHSVLSSRICTPGSTRDAVS